MFVIISVKFMKKVFAVHAPDTEPLNININVQTAKDREQSKTDKSHKQSTALLVGVPAVLKVICPRHVLTAKVTGALV